MPLDIDYRTLFASAAFTRQQVALLIRLAEEIYADAASGGGGGGSGMTWTTISSADVATAVTDNGYVMETGGVLRTVTLPASVPAGFYVAVNASGGQVRIVSNGNVIDQVGPGNDLLLDDGATAVLVAKAVGSLEILYGGEFASTGTGTVSTVSVVTANGVSGSVANPTTTPAITLTLGAITPSSVAASGAVSGSNLSGTNTGDQTITLTGAVTGSGTGSFATTLAVTLDAVPDPVASVDFASQ
jgi:hypothetical protein